MEKVSFGNLLFHTAFCCMACDGDIDAEGEVPLLKSMCEKLPLLKDIDFQKDVNIFIGQINEQGKGFLMNYLNVLKNASLSEEEELILIDYAIQMIKADNIIQYSEVKFFKTIRHRLKISDEKILEKFPDIEQFLEDDIETESLLDRITSQYLDIANLPTFEFISIDASLLEKK